MAQFEKLQIARVGDYTRRRVERWRFDRSAQRPGAPHVLGVGDSHASAIGPAAARLGWPVNVFAVGGATAQGLHNPNSRTDALGKFEKRCQQARSWQHLVFLLGEVDCGFLIWYRAEKYGVSAHAQVERSLAGYTALLDRQIRRGLSTTVVSVPLPTILDGQDWGDVANARREVKATLRERTDLTLEYNAALRERCDTIGAWWVDATSDMLDPNLHVIKDSYRNPNRLDHHLASKPYGALIAAGLSDALTGQRDFSGPRA